MTNNGIQNIYIVTEIMAIKKRKLYLKTMILLIPMQKKLSNPGKQT